MKAPSPEFVETRIDTLAAGGDGVGRMPDGRALFVAFAAPGDTVRVRVIESKKRFARGRIEEIREPAAGRATPVCEVFGVCGGCSWQHLDYATQLEAKGSIVRDALVRIGHFDIPSPVPMTASPQAYAYRNRARVVQSGAELGYRRRRSHRVCAVERCPVLVPPLERALSRIAETAASHPTAREEEWELSAGADGGTRWDRVGDTAAARTSVEMRAGADRLRISGGVFAQGNAFLLDALVAAVARAAERGASVVELFAGAGLLTLQLSRHFDCVFALESNRRAVEDLAFNLRTAGRTNVFVHAGRVEETLVGLDIHRPDAAVLDPPRTGVPSEALAALIAMEPRRIVYLSCDPATLARDLARLRDDGYRLLRVEGFDLFPQTPHVEALAVLERHGTPTAR